MGEDRSPMGEDLAPMGEILSPMGANLSPMGENLSPMGENLSPMGENLSPIGEDFSLTGRDFDRLTAYECSVPLYRGYPTYCADNGAVLLFLLLSIEFSSREGLIFFSIRQTILHAGWFCA
jgi:hypothetical protein